MNVSSSTRSRLTASRTFCVAWLWRHRKDILYRVGAGALMLLWLQLFPLYLLILYFAQRGFLSFDLLTSGLFGVNTVFAWTTALLALFAVYLWLFPFLCIYHLFIVKSHKPASGNPTPKKVPRAVWWASGTLCFLIWTALFLSPLTDNWDLVLALAMFSAMLALAVCMFIKRSIWEVTINWQAPLVLVVFSAFIPAMAHEHTAQLIDVGLKQFRIGGMLPVRVDSIGAAPSDAPIAQGRLLLASTDHIFIDAGNAGNRKLIVLTNTQNLRVEIGNKDGRNSQ